MCRSGSPLGLRCGSESPPVPARTHHQCPGAAAGRHQCFGLVGADRQWHVARAQLRQCVGHAIEQARAAQQALAVVHHEDRHHLGQVDLTTGGVHGLFDQAAHAVADPAEHGGFRHACHADVFQRAVQCFGDISCAVDQRAIKVEHDQRIGIRQGTAPARRGAAHCTPLVSAPIRLSRSGARGWPGTWAGSGRSGSAAAAASLP